MHRLAQNRPQHQAEEADAQRRARRLVCSPSPSVEARADHHLAAVVPQLFVDRAGCRARRAARRHPRGSRIRNPARRPACSRPAPRRPDPGDAAAVAPRAPAARATTDRGILRAIVDHQHRHAGHVLREFAHHRAHRAPLRCTRARSPAAIRARASACHCSATRRALTE